MKPKISYIICTTQRSGSTHLCELLMSTGVAGTPREYFVDKKFPEFFAREGVSSLEDYVPRIMQSTASDNGVFGLKIMAHFFFSLMDQLRALPAYQGMSNAEITHTIFPGTKFIALARRDKIRQAISLLNAHQSGMWNSNQLPSGSTAVSTKMDVHGIDAMTGMLVNQEARWQAFFNEANIAPLSLVYEDYSQDNEAAVRCVLDYIGVAAPADWQPALARTGKKMTAPDADKLRADYMKHKRTQADRFFDSIYPTA